MRHLNGRVLKIIQQTGHKNVSVNTNLISDTYRRESQWDSPYWRLRDNGTPKRPDQIWGPYILKVNWYRGSFQGIKRPRRQVTTNFHIQPSWRMSGATPLLPLYDFMTRTERTLRGNRKGNPPPKYWRVKVKQSHYRPGVIQRVPES